MKNKNLLLRIFKFLKKYQPRLFLAAISLLTVVSCILLLGKQMQHFVDSNLLINGHSLTNTIFLITIFGSASFLRSYIINSTAEFAASDVKREAYSKLLNFSSTEMDKYNYSDLSTRINSDCESICKIIIDFTSFYVRNALTTIGGIIFMFYASAKLSIGVFALIGSITFIATKISKKVRKLTKDAENAKLKSSNLVLESIINSKVIFSFDTSNTLQNYFDNLNNAAKSKISKRLKFRSLFFASVITSLLFIIIAILWYGSLEVQSGNLSSGKLVSFLFYSFLTALSFGGIIEMMNDLEKNLIAAERIFEIIDSKAIQQDTNKLIDLKNFKNIELKNLSYKYSKDNKENVIENLNIDIKENQFNVIAGTSGVGKTTILNIILGLYKPLSGEIKIGNDSYDYITPKMWNHKIAYVPQDSLLFSGSIIENITLFSDNPDISIIESIIEKLNLTDLINSLENGINTDIGSLASKISGGQKQRIALARALYKKPEILILDEATSQLDEKTEQKILDYLIKNFKNKTIICVAHRKGAIDRAENLINL